MRALAIVFASCGGTHFRVLRCRPIRIRGTAQGAALRTMARILGLQCAVRKAPYTGSDIGNETMIVKSCAIIDGSRRRSALHRLCECGAPWLCALDNHPIG
jgi:hypothetical protein